MSRYQNRTAALSASREEHHGPEADIINCCFFIGLEFVLVDGASNAHDRHHRWTEGDDDRCDHRDRPDHADICKRQLQRERAKTTRFVL